MGRVKFITGLIEKLKDVYIPFNKQHNMHYGITAYEVLSIIKPDYTIVNVWADYVQAAILDDLVNICRYRYGIKINAIGVSNISIYNDHSTMSPFAFRTD